MWKKEAPQRLQRELAEAYRLALRADTVNKTASWQKRVMLLVHALATANGSCTAFSGIAPIS